MDKAAYAREWRAKQSPEWWENNRKYMRNRLANRSPESIAEENKYKRDYYNANKSKCAYQSKARRLRVKSDPKYIEQRKFSRKSKKARDRYRKKFNTPADCHTITLSEWRSLIRVYGGKCFYCKSVPSGPIEQDHWIPLSKGGEHTMENIVPACNDCNRRKQARDPIEFLLSFEKAGGRV